MPQVISRSSVSKTGFLGQHQLLQDTMPLQVLTSETIAEGKDGDGNTTAIVRLGGQFQYANRKNANGRIYEGQILKQAISEIQEDVKRRAVMGELDHPPDAKIHLDRVSHILSKLWMEGDAVMGEIEVLGTPMGNLLKSIIESKVTIGISSRGVGDMETTMHEGEEVLKVLPGYTFVTFDVVAEPSVQGSYLSVMESRNRLTGGQPKSRSSVERAILKETKNFLRK